MRGQWVVDPDEPTQPWRIYVCRLSRLSLLGWCGAGLWLVGAMGVLFCLLAWKLVGALLIYSLCCLWFEDHFRNTAFARDSEDDLIDHPPVITQYLVQVMLYRDGVLCGIDKGYISFADGWMVFRGVRSNWSFGPADVECSGHLGSREDLPDGEWSRWRVVSDETPVTLCLRHPSIHWLERLYGLPIGWRSKPSRAWAEDLGAWANEPQPDGLVVLPPGGAHPGARLYPWLVMVSAVWTALWCSALTIGFLRYGWADLQLRIGDRGLALMATFFAGALLAGIVANRLRSLRKACRDEATLSGALALAQVGPPLEETVRWRGASSRLDVEGEPTKSTRNHVR